MSEIDQIDRYLSSGSSEDFIRRKIAEMSVVYPDKKISDVQASAMIAIYVSDLEDIPSDILGRAFVKCRKTCRFFPTIAEIRSASDEIAKPLRVRRNLLYSWMMRK